MSPANALLVRTLAPLGLALVVCTTDGSGGPGPDAGETASDTTSHDTQPHPTDGGHDAADTEHDGDDAGDESGGLDATDADVSEVEPFVVVTFNVGTTPGLPHNTDDRDQEQVYSAETAALVDEHYNNSLAWMPAERHLTSWIAAIQPDIISMQELFHDPWCVEESIPVFAGLDLICEIYNEAAPLQIARLLGPPYQIACGLRKPDTCLGVHRAFGSVRECSGTEVCIGGLAGVAPPSGCTSRDRAGRVHIDLPDGNELIVVALHGTSGGSVSDAACRLDNFRQIWEDRGDGEPLVGNGVDAIVLGDFNTDPVLFVEADPSAAYLAATIASDGDGWRWHSPIDPAGPRSYTLASIDHVVSNAFAGTCEIPGSSEGVEPVWDRVFWDHRPVVCMLTPR